MTALFIATGNPGKQAEIAAYAKAAGKDIAIQFPDKTSGIYVIESGATFEENARLKARAYQQIFSDPSMLFVGDDSGIKIPALNNEPGVFTRRWAGHEMTDKEIVRYCLEKMKHLKGTDREAIFETVLAVIKGDDEPEYYRGQMRGHILEAPMPGPLIEGFPFRSIFWVDEINKPIYEVHDLPPDERGTFRTHRERAFEALFAHLQ